MLPVPCLLELQDFVMGNATFEVIQDSRNLTLVRTQRVAQQRLIIPDLHTEITHEATLCCQDPLSVERNEREGSQEAEGVHEACFV